MASQRVTLYDVLKVMQVRNLKRVGGWPDKGTWMNFHLLVDFFKELREELQESDPKWLSSLLVHTQSDDIDRALNVLMFHSRHVYWIGHDDNLLFMSNAQAEEATEHYKLLSRRKQIVLDRIARRYGKKLKQIGR